MNRNIEGLRNHLFAQIERLGDEDLNGDALQEEIRRGKAISQLSSSIIDAAKAEFAYLEMTGGLNQSSFVDAPKSLPGASQEN